MSFDFVVCFLVVHSVFIAGLCALVYRLFRLMEICFEAWRSTAKDLDGVRACTREVLENQAVLVNGRVEGRRIHG